MRDLYSILGVDRQASKDKIRRAYRSLARKHHPDMNNGRESQEMVEINYAYSILSDDAKREAYDTTGTTNTSSEDELVFQEFIGALHRNLRSDDYSDRR